MAPYQDYEELDILTMLDTNVKGLMASHSLFLAFYGSNNQGHINMGSTAEGLCYAGAAVYSAARRQLRLSDGPQYRYHRSGHQVTTIQPGIVETDFLEYVFHGDKERAATVCRSEALRSSGYRRHDCLCPLVSPVVFRLQI